MQDSVKGFRRRRLVVVSPGQVMHGPNLTCRVETDGIGADDAIGMGQKPAKHEDATEVH